MSIKSKLLISYIFLVIFSVSVLGLLIGHKSHNAVFTEVTEKSERITELINNMVSVRDNLLSEKIWTDLHYADKRLDDLGEINIINEELCNVGDFLLPSLYAGNTNLNIDNSLVNEIKDSTSAIASIFLLKDDKLIRINTNIIIGGEIAIGSYVTSDSEIYKNIINNKSYYGRTCFDGIWYTAGYEPLLDKNGTIIGAIALGHKQLNDYLEETINKILIGKTGYVYVMNSKGDAIVHPHIKGENLIDFDFSKEIIKNKTGLIEYTFNGTYKLAAYTYFEPWDWHIVTTANYDDLNSSSRSILFTTLIVGFIIFLVSIIIALILSHTLLRPMKKLKDCMEIAGKGDLTVQCDINNNDEIGVLSKSFNTLIKENKKLLEETREYNRLKGEFFSNISHELKTPLNIIFSTIQLLSIYNNNNSNNEDFQNTKVDTYLSIMKQNCYRLLRLVNNLIDITKIDSGYLNLNLQNKNIVEVVENITLSTVEYVESKSRRIIFDTDIEEKITAFDLEKMERIILNLISNAVKFTKPNDKITVRIYNAAENICISIKDTGKGIPLEKQKLIFERFRQIDRLLSRSHEGSGIGLSLVKSLVEMHHGKISVNSTYGKGTEFIIELPVKLISEENNTELINDYPYEANVEKIQIEFSDIYT